MATRIMLPCEGFSPAWEWADDWQLDVLRDWWGLSARLVRESVGAPAWAEYLDRDGAAWTRRALIGRMILDAIDVYGEAHVEATLDELGSERARDVLDGWIDGRVFAGELVRLVGEDEA